MIQLIRYLVRKLLVQGYYVLHPKPPQPIAVQRKPIGVSPIEWNKYLHLVELQEREMRGRIIGHGSNALMTPWAVIISLVLVLLVGSSCMAWVFAPEPLSTATPTQINYLTPNIATILAIDDFAFIIQAMIMILVLVSIGGIMLR